VVRIVLAAVDAPLADAWERFCGDLADVSVHRGSIFDVACDAVVSPANSFGFMDGGLDALYLRRFGWGLQQRLQAVLREHHHGELVVGAAEMIETGDAAIPFLLAAPTMRVPMILADTVNPYLAARAALLLCAHGRLRDTGTPIAVRVRTVAFPGLGTGVGRVPPDVCARQVRAAIEWVRGAQAFPRSWAEASARHQLLYTDHPRDLQYPK
jgi:O-acetyl-ADP-ribose deacetylase (regulator of RNase III)